MKNYKESKLPLQETVTNKITILVIISQNNNNNKILVTINIFFWYYILSKHDGLVNPKLIKKPSFQFFNTQEP